MCTHLLESTLGTRTIEGNLCGLKLPNKEQLLEKICANNFSLFLKVDERLVRQALQIVLRFAIALGS